MKVLKNILLNTNDNNLRIADIYFSEKIKEIRFRSEGFNWTDVNTKDKRKIIAAEPVKVKYPKN